MTPAREHKILEGQISLFEIEGNHTNVVVLNEGKYSGVQYIYGDVDFSEEEEGGEVSVNFKYQVLNNAGHETETPEFKNYIGDILSYLMSLAVSESPEDMKQWSDFKLA